MTEQTEVFQRGTYTFEKWIDGWVQILVKGATTIYEGFEKDISKDLLKSIEDSEKVIASKKTNG